jgi:hypothetical protein
VWSCRPGQFPTAANTLAAMENGWRRDRVTRSLSAATGSRMAALSSASEKKRRVARLVRACWHEFRCRSAP